MSGSTIVGDAIYNAATINDYCGVTITTYGGVAPNAISCYTVTFGQSGLSSAAAWGVTVTWPFGTTDHTGSGGSIVVSNLGGPISYSYDTPVTYSGTSYKCVSGCTGAPTVGPSTAPSASYASTAPRLPPIPPGAAPSVLNIPTYGNATFTGHRVGMIGGAMVEYNIPGWNSTLFTQELYANNPGAWDIFPIPVTSCTDSNGNVRTSGFFMSWFGGGLNSTEITFGDYQSFTSSAVGWPPLASCGG